MIYFKKRPACRAAISLAAGIIVTYYLPSIVILAFFLLCLLFLIFFSKNKDIKLIILMIMLGIILLGSKEIIYNHSIPQKYWNKNKIVNLKGIIREDLQAIDDNKLFLKVKDINGEKIYAAKLEIDKRYLTKDFVDGDLIYGNFILNRGNEQRNPGGFSYRTYLKKNGLLGTAYPVKIIKHDHNYKLNIGTHLIRLKKSLIQIIDQNCSSPLQGIYKALILGERASLPDNWSTSFEKAGASHLLAISGLHLGFIVILLNLIGKILIIPNKYWNILISIIILVYILITGGRASVFRAGTLTLLFLWAPFINRKADTFNILGFSVIILLIINPYNLFMVGFQLTYIILMVILIYHKIFSSYRGLVHQAKG
ncbi:MAG: ComEC/Rec2 family competence protein, partial [bacterium]